MEWIKTSNNMVVPDNDRWVIVSKNGHTQVIPHHYDVKSDKWYWYISGEEQFDIEAWCDYPDAPNLPILTWQYSTSQDPELWKDATNDEYYIGQHLAKYNWRQIEK